jgi:hypothetical protein
MSNILYISPIQKSTPNLFSSFKKTFEENGVYETQNLDDANFIFFDCYSDLGVYDTKQIEEINNLQIPVISFQEKDYGGISTEEWQPLDKFPNCKTVQFVRKLDKTKKYPHNIYPYELIQYQDHDFPITRPYDLFIRENDICFIGNESPFRKSVMNWLSLSGLFKIDCLFPKERIPNKEWLNRHFMAKCFVEADGGGFGSERPFQLIPVSVMLRQKNNMKRLNDWTDGVDCLEISKTPTKDEIKNIYNIFQDKDRLYDIYYNGYQRLKNYFNAEWRAKYILSVINNCKSLGLI